MIDSALAVVAALATATALAGIGAATAWAIQASDADRARRDAERSLARQLVEAERLRRLCRESDAALASTREELRQARLALVAADAELERRNEATGENGEGGAS